MNRSTQPDYAALDTVGVHAEPPNSGMKKAWDAIRRGLATAAATIAMGAACTAETPSPLSDLDLAHDGSAKVDTAFLNRAPQPDEIQSFFSVARKAFQDNPRARFAELEAVGAAAETHGLSHLGGPMLGAIAPDGARVWVRTVKPSQVTVRVQTSDQDRLFGPVRSSSRSDHTARVDVKGLEPSTRYRYEVLIDGEPIAMPPDAAITTAPEPNASSRTKIAFGADFHKSGLWNKPLLDQVRTRKNIAMLLLGDSAVDDRNALVGLHRSDYMLRDLSPAWRELAASAAIYAVWDDHDYFDNDKSGVPNGATDADRRAVRTVWKESWNNPGYGLEGAKQGIFFRTRIGPCDVIMLDTRFFRTSPGKANSILGDEQTGWLENQLADCTAPFLILTSGTMWSDYISAGKDSWGIWDRPGRERLLSLIEKRPVGGVLLLSGDRHGARVLRIPRPSGFTFYEFELGSLGGHQGPAAFGSRPENQTFGLTQQPAFGEFEFDTTPADPTVTMRVVNQEGEVLYQLALTRSQLTPPAP